MPRRTAQSGAMQSGQTTQDGNGEGHQGCLGRTGFRSSAGKYGEMGDANGIANAQGYETLLHWTQVAYETTHNTVSLGRLAEGFLARTCWLGFPSSGLWCHSSSG